MDLSVYLNSMRDAAGLPFYPIVFQVLLVLTFSVHIVMVNLVLGSSFLAVYEVSRKSEFGARLSKALGRIITVGLSIAIVLGVAPLLFVQVIYDPFWYTATSLSAFWALMFLVAITLAFYSSYGFYLGNKKSSPGEMKARWAYVAIFFLLLTALFIHMLSMEQLTPEKWKAWIISKEGFVSFSGGEFHSVNLGRLLHFIIPSFAVTGVYLMLYASYFSEREDYDSNYLDYVAKRGANLALWASVLTVASGFWWLGTIPKDFSFAQNPFLIIGAVLGIITTAYLGAAYLSPGKRAKNAAILMFLTIFFMSCAREGLRMHYMNKVGYSIYNYPLNVDWPSTILFFATFIMGLFVLCFPAAAAFKAGKAPKGQVVIINPTIVRNSLYLMIAWFVVVAGLGIVISLKNGTLF